MNCALRESVDMKTEEGRFPPEDDSGVLALSDECFDDTVVDLSDCDQITLTQTDEAGRTHTVILSAQHVAQLFPHMDLWKTNNSPPIFLIPLPLN